MTVQPSSTGTEELFECREFEEDAFRSMEVQICGKTRTVQFSASDHGGDHPTSPAVAIDWSEAIDLANWILSHAAAQRPVDSGEFDDWFDRTFLDPDGGSAHLPDWFRGDMQQAWNAALECGAESNRHSGAVGAEKRAEQGNPGGGHVTEPQLPEPYERKAAGMIPRPAADSRGIAYEAKEPDIGELADVAESVFLPEIASLREALEFYADPTRYSGPNSRLEDEPDKYQPEGLYYRLDATRDGGRIARKALAISSTDRGGGK